MVRQRPTEEKAFSVVPRERKYIKGEGKRHTDAKEMTMSARQE